jgi:DNA polymerase-3 subunit alpha
LQAAGDLQQDRRSGQKNFFDALGEDKSVEPEAAHSLPDIPEWPDNERLKYEKEALDFYFSSHPLAQHDKQLRAFASHRVENLANLPPNQEVLLGGMLTQIRFQNTKKARNGNTRYVRCKMEDFTGAAECVMWPDDFQRYREEFVEDRVCLVRGTVERTREEPGLILTRVIGLEQAQAELTRWLRLSLGLGLHGPHHLERIAQILQRTPGSCPVYLDIRDASGNRCALKAGERFRVNPAQVPVEELEMILGPGRIEFCGNGS